LFVSAFGRFFRDFVAAIGRFPQRCGVLSGRATLAAVAVRQAEKVVARTGRYPVAPERANETRSNPTRTAKRNRLAGSHEKNRPKFAKLLFVQ
jgi:hypothetical protein